MGRGVPNLPDIQRLLQAGIDPWTGLPLKLMGGKPEFLVQDAKRAYSLIDEQNAINRFQWINLPDGIDGKLIERILYYKGQAALSFIEEQQRFVFLPYTLASDPDDASGGLDIYGRYKSIHLIQFMGATDPKTYKYIGKRCKVQYDIQLDEQTMDTVDKAVILWDYSPQLSQIIQPRAMIQQWVLQMMAEDTSFLRTKLIIGTGINGLKCNGADQINDVRDLSRGMINAAMEGSPYVGIDGAAGLELQGLEKTNPGTMRSEDYLMALQSLDNIRLSAYGLDNGGIFEKKAHITNDELAMNGSSVGLVYQDSLSQRQRFCDIVNSLWGLNIDCVPSENVIGMDMNGDGMVADDSDTPIATPGSEEEGEADGAIV